MNEEIFIKKIIRTNTRKCPECEKNVKGQILKDPKTEEISIYYYHHHKDFSLKKSLNKESVKKMIKDYEKKKREKTKKTNNR